MDIFEKRKRDDEIVFIKRKSQVISEKDDEERLVKGYTQSAVNAILVDQMSDELSTLLLLRQTIDQRIRELQLKIYSST